MDWAGLLGSVFLLMFISQPVLHVQGTSCSSRATGLNPRKVGTAGGVYLTVQGEDFASNQLSVTADFTVQEAVGNAVELHCPDKVYNCPVWKDETNERQIVCIIPPIPQTLGCKAFVEVDGNPLSDECQTTQDFKTLNDHTPTIEMVTPRYQPPASTTTFCGKIFTDISDSTQLGGSDADTTKLRRCFFGTNVGELVSIELHGSDDEGCITVRDTSTQVGHRNVSYLLKGGGHGRSKVQDGAMFVSPGEVPYSYQNYPVISSITPAEGSLEGGTFITITGVGFYSEKITVKVGGDDCEIQKVTETMVICQTPSKPDGIDDKEFHAGNRGVYRTVTGIANVTGPELLDQFGFVDPEAWDNYKTYTEACFVPPRTGKYRFYLLSDDPGQVHFSQVPLSKSDTELLLSCTGYCPKYYNGHRNVRDTNSVLEAGKCYHLNATHTEYGGASELHVGVHIYNTSLTRQALNYKIVRQEKQRVHVNSNWKMEVQNITIPGDIPSKTSAPTVQRVNVTIPDSFNPIGFSIRLCLYGACTVRLPPFDSNSRSKFENALADLPIWDKGLNERVSVTRNDAIYDITFTNRRGNMPLMTYQTIGGGMGEEISITTQTGGVSDNSHLVMSFAGLPSPPIKLSTLTNQTFTDALNNTFKAQCPPSIISPNRHRRAFYAGFEWDGTGFDIGDHEHYHMDFWQPAFCGHVSLKNSYYVYNYDTFKRSSSTPRISIQTNPWLCFAARGRHLKNAMRFKLNNNWRWIDTPKLNLTDAWSYHCVNMLEEVKGQFTSTTDDDELLLDRFVFDSERLAADYWIDEVYIGRDKIAEHTEDVPSRVIPGLVQGFTMKAAYVTGPEEDGDNKVYQIRLHPNGCVVDFDLIKVEHLEETTEGNGEYTYRGTDFTTPFTIVRHQAATEAVTGTYTVTIDGQTSSAIDITWDPEAVNAQLEADFRSTVGEFRVTEDWHHNCSNPRVSIEYLSHAGDQEEMGLNGSLLMGPDVSSDIVTTQHGGLFFKDIPQDYLRTIQTTPQVTLMYEDIPARCNVTDLGNCSYSWVDVLTPSITSASPTSGKDGTEITINGTNLAEENTGNYDNSTVTVCSQPCTISAHTDTQIRCTVREGTRGSAKIQLHIEGKGWAAHPESGDVMFECTADIDSVTPVNGGNTGGYPLTVNGHGFNSQSTVTVDGVPCPITSLTYSTIVCTVPASSTAGAVDVVLVHSDHTNITKTDAFTYDSRTQPVVTAITPATLTVHGGNVTIEGTDFPDDIVIDDIVVKVGGVPASNKVSYNSSIGLVVTLPAMAIGGHDLEVLLGNAGFADTSTNSIQVSYQLEVHLICPDAGSHAGGTEVTITGAGFTADAVVTFGDVDCESVTVTSSTSIECTTASLVKTHAVENSGSSEHGARTRWEPYMLEIVTGDTVHWTWRPQSSGGEKRYKVEQTATAIATQYDGSGFRSSSTSTRTGSFLYTFLTAGTYFYWTDIVDPNTGLIMRGVIEVRERAALRYPVRVTIRDQLATYMTSGTCSIDGSATGCTESLSADADNTDVDFVYGICNTPAITAISPLNEQMTITPDEQLVLRVERGTTTPADVSVTVCGDKVCDVSATSLTEVNCTIQHENTLAINQLCAVEMSIADRGRAMLNLADYSTRKRRIVPRLTSVSPRTGSVHGGTRLTVTGVGLERPHLDGSDVDPVVCIGDGASGCRLCSPLVGAVTYTQVECMTSASPDAAAAAAGNPLLVYVRVTAARGRQQLPALCVTDADCEFTFEAASTPDITGISPALIASDSGTLAIAGQGFGTNPAHVIVELLDTHGEPLPGNPLSVDAVTDAEINVTSSGVRRAASPYRARVRVTNTGYSDEEPINAASGVTDFSPKTGGLCGKVKVTVTGYGFPEAGDIRITAGAAGDCAVESATATEVVCSMPSSDSAGEVTLELQVHNEAAVNFPAAFDYQTALTPTLTSISPTSGATTGDTVTITGTGFVVDETKVTVTFAQTEVAATASNATTIEVPLPEHTAGQVEVGVIVEDKGCASTASAVTYTFAISVDDINPAEGGYFGGQTVTVTGTGFGTTGNNVTICGVEARSITSQSVTSIELVTPSVTNTGATRQCDVIVTTSAGETAIGNNIYTYSEASTPDITSMAPTQGGTGGGTTITISGSFGSSMGTVSVLGRDDCGSVSWSASEITCNVPRSPASQQIHVQVHTANGDTEQTASSLFEYIDLWSSDLTWGSGGKPGTGGFAVVTEGNTVVLDEDTPVLKMLLIKGGTVKFTRTANVTLNAENIFITDGGRLEVGTRENPHCPARATIKMHGKLRAKELPIYGAKTLAVRNGTLDLHGCPKHVTWTRLRTTAAAGTNQLRLRVPVEWEVGDKIVVTSTGDRLSQNQNEVFTISEISADKLVLTLSGNLQNEKLSVTETFGGQEVTMAAEVGLLSHNVVVEGSDDVAWHDDIPACRNGFEPGEFKVQTCFQGRFGAEEGSDQFGATIMFHAPEMDSQAAVAHIEYTEVTYAGQAFRLGRYPIHFHVNGNMSRSFVRGCAIHNTFNRAVNIHGSHGILIEHNVGYHIMGGAFFLEDGVETKNVFQYNLAVMVISSTSLLNDDITPAAFWVTNPDNRVRHNAAAGGTHFGFWYRLHDRPDGISAVLDVFPQRVPLLEFANNTVHSQGWFGLWIFQTYKPQQSPNCRRNCRDQAARFEGLTTWRCEKAAEWVDCGACQFDGFVSVDNSEAGLEAKFVKSANLFKTTGAAILNSLIVGHSRVSSAADFCTKGGLVLPLLSGLLVENVTFVNFDRASCKAAVTHAKAQGTCTFLCSGSSHRFKGIRFVSSTRKAAFEWSHQSELQDADGSLTGAMETGSVVPTVPILPSTCTNLSEFSVGEVPASRCPADVQFVRFSFNKAQPRSLWFKTANFSNGIGQVEAPFATKRTTHKDGWTVLLPVATSDTIQDVNRYTMLYEDVPLLTNVSYRGTFSTIPPGARLQLGISVQVEPDQVQILNSKTSEAANLSNTGDWTYDSGLLSYLIRNTGDDYADVNVNFKAIRCFYRDCTKPDGIADLSEVTSRPPGALYWSQMENWTDVGPLDGSQNITIPANTWIVLDEQPQVFDTLTIEGSLEINVSMTLEAKRIIIAGGHLVAGFLDDPFRGDLTILMAGRKDDPTYDFPGASNPIPSKTIAVFGGLVLHGLPRVSWVKLTETVMPGESVLQVSEETGWMRGDDVVLSPTSFSPEEYEERTVSSTNGTRLTLDRGVTFRHRGSTHTAVYTEGSTVRTRSYTTQGEVALLSRNIRIVGKSYPEMKDPDSYGAYVLISIGDLNNKIVKGYARISNVEFENTGQEGYERENQRCSISFIGLDNSDNPLSVNSSSFHSGLGPGICVWGSDDVQLTSNVHFKVIPSGVRIVGRRARVERNLMVYSQWPGTYLNRRESTNYDYTGAIDVAGAEDLTLVGNVAAGCQRSCIKLPHKDCSDIGEPSLSWRENEVHAGLVGVERFVKGGSTSCMEVYNFKSWNMWDFGIFIEVPTSLVMKNVTSINNGVGLFPMVIKPSPLDHQSCTDNPKYARIEDSFIVGSTPDFDCAEKALLTNLPYVQLSRKGRSFRKDGDDGFVGISLTQFSGGFNGATFKPLKGILTYNTVCGLSEITDTLFSNFGNYCDEMSVMLMTNPANEDLIHPVHITHFKMANSTESSKVFLSAPNVGKVNPSDCVDMDCDAKKKNLIKDLDGSFLGLAKGHVISKSEINWGGDQRHGTGDYRIPKVALTNSTGSRLDVGYLYGNNKGIYRGDAGQCVYMEDWQAYKCHDLDYYMLVIESLDTDTEKRRLSPVAVVGYGTPDGGILDGASAESAGRYIDLINGPQDHGWCDGYTCQERISTFHAMVTDRGYYDIFMTSTEPQKLRLQMLNTNGTQLIRVGVYYRDPQSLMVTKDGVNVTRGPGQGAPPVITTVENVGDNYYDPEAQMIYVIVGHSHVIEIHVIPMVRLSIELPEMTIDEFFGDQIVANLAIFLGVDPGSISYSLPGEDSRRKKRQEPGLVVVFVITPLASGNDGLTETDKDKIRQVSSTLVTAVQLNTLAEALNVSNIGSVSVIEPPPSPDDAAWQVYASSDTLGIPVVVVTPRRAVLLQQPGLASEGAPMGSAAAIQLLDDEPPNGRPVCLLGSTAYPWRMRARLRGGDPSAILLEEEEVPFVNCWANFTRLSVSHTGEGYTLEFYVSSPANASTIREFQVTSQPFAVQPVSYEARVTSQPPEVRPEESFDLQVGLINAVTRMAPLNISWKGHTFTATLSQYSRGGYTGSIQVPDNDIIVADNGSVTFTNLQVTSIGCVYLRVRVTSSPPDFALTVRSLPIDVSGAYFSTRRTLHRSDVSLRLPGLTPAGADDIQFFLAAIKNKFAATYSDVTLANFTNDGDVVRFAVWGEIEEVKAAVDGIWEQIKVGVTINEGGTQIEAARWMQVDGREQVGEKEPRGFDVRLLGIILGVIFGLFLLAALIGVLVWCLCLKGSKAKGKVEPTTSGNPATTTTTRTGHQGVNQGPGTYRGSFAEPADPSMEA